MLDFKPPRESSLIIGTARVLLPLLLKGFLKVVKVDVDESSLEQITRTDGSPTVFAPNHPGHPDSAVMFWVSAHSRRLFRYLAARESFGIGGSVRGFLMQSLGAYSVIRGAADRRSFRLTMDYLSNKNGKLVIFPEGEVSLQNDTVMPFENGVVQSCFWALDQMRRADNLRQLFIVPVGIRYLYIEPMWNEIDIALKHLEEKLFDSSYKAPDNIYTRLRDIGVKMVSVLEREHLIKPEDTSTLNDRIEHLKHHILNQIEAFLAIPPDADSTPIKRVRVIKNLIDDEMYDDVPDATSYIRQIHAQRIATFMKFHTELNRLTNFNAIYDGYVAESPTQERFLEVISRFEVEVFGRSKIRGPTSAIVRIGEPKNLLESYEDYRARKRQTTQKVTLQLEAEVQDLVRRALP